MADIPDKQIKRMRALLSEAETNVAAAKELLISIVGEDSELVEKAKDKALGKVIEGVFDGQNMVGSDAKTYPVPANYASKSKLVQGDILKLTIADDGSFLYKQIGPVPRKQVVGVLSQKDGHYFVEVDNKEYRVLLASVT
jgi:type IV secretory pathway protease TraF